MTTGFLDHAENFHPYECDGPGKCRHCDRRKDATHDPATCALCDPEYDHAPNPSARATKGGTMYAMIAAAVVLVICVPMLCIVLLNGPQR